MPTDLEREKGHGNTGLLPWDAFGDPNEAVPALQGREAFRTYNSMRNDAQIASLVLGFTLPIRRWEWYIAPNGARDEVVELVAGNFNLPIEGQDPTPSGRRRDRFSHDRHLFHALLSIPFGAMFFEQVYRYDEETRRFHLRKLAPRMPATVSEIQTARDGGLEYIRQYPAGNSLLPRSPTALIPSYDLQSPKITIDRLVAYVNEQEAGNWRGLSWLRALYRHWLRKDRLLRVDAITGERNGTGVPIGYAPVGASDAQMKQMAALTQGYRSGEYSGGSLPPGWDLKFKGVEGTLPDIIEKVRYDDEQMAARFLGMAFKLGRPRPVRERSARP
jgi:hypothetical protein